MRKEKKRKGRRKEKGKEKKKKRKEMRKRKKGKKMRKKKKREEGEPCVEERRRKKKKERHFPLRSLTNRRSKQVGARDKVGPRDESYAWVPETAGFVAFQKVGVSPALVISSLVAM